MDIDLYAIAIRLAQLGVAYILAMPVAWNRERGHKRNAGLRTFPLVAIAACGYALMGLEVLDTTEARARIVAGIVTGIGFIGGGAILKNESGVRGTATAASLWITGAIGIAVAFNRYEIAIVLSLVTFFTLQFIPYIKEEIVDD